MARAHLAGAAIALFLASCGGGGGGGGEPEPLPPEAPPPAPVPPPSGGPTDPGANQDPVADAGPDRMTVEEQDVVVDGSGTHDAENDPIVYRWELVAAPQGSRIAVSATSPTFNFRPDVPGTYELRLTAGDGRGSTSDTMRVTADALATLAEGTHAFRVEPDSPPESGQIDLAVKTSAHYDGPQVPLQLSSSVPWLTLPASVTTAAPGEITRIPIRLNAAEVGRLENGEHAAHLTVKPQGGWEAVDTQVSLALTLPIVHAVVPYVAYAGAPSRITLYGEHLEKTHGRSVVVNGVEAPGLVAISDSRAHVELPPLPAAGTFALRIANALDIPREMARIVVRAAPQYADSDVPLPGLVQQAEYDPERDSLYALFRAPFILGTVVTVARRIRHAAGTWQVEPIDVPGRPRALTLTADGARLLVTSDACAVHELDPETLAVLASQTKPSCDPSFEPFGAIAALADGRVLVMDVDSDSTVWEYPGFEPSNVLPEAIHPFAALNYERNRLLWAELPEGIRDWRAWYYDIHGAARDWRGQPGYWRYILAMSGDGLRTVHRADVYDEAMRLIGTLGGLTNATDVAPGLDRHGRRAVVLDDHAERLVVSDLTAAGPIFPPIASIPLPGDVTASSLVMVAPTDRTAFVFAGSRSLGIFGPIDLFTLFVRNLP